MFKGPEFKKEPFTQTGLIPTFRLATASEAQHFPPDTLLGHRIDQAGRIIYTPQQSLFCRLAPCPNPTSFARWANIIGKAEQRSKPSETLVPKSADEIEQALPFGIVIYDIKPLLVLKGLSGLRITDFNGRYNNKIVNHYEGKAVMARIGMVKLLDELAAFALKDNQGWTVFLSAAEYIIGSIARHLYQEKGAIFDHETVPFFRNKLNRVTPMELRRLFNKTPPQMEMELVNYNSDTHSFEEIT